MFVIIGNGFDLNLGLKTSYSDFVESKEFSDVSSLYLSKIIRSKHENSNWVDIEEELDSYIKLLSNVDDRSDKNLKISARNFPQEYDNLKKALISYLDRVTFDPEYRDGHALHFAKSLKEESARVFNFNYTDSFTNITKWTDSKKLHHVHGAIKNKEIIFGAGGNSDGVDKQYRYIKKASSPIFSKEFHQFLGSDSQQMNSVKIAIFGHSLGPSDYDYFKPIFNFHGYKNIELEIYHYKAEGLQALEAEIDQMLDMTMYDFKTRVADIKYIDVSE